MKPINLFILLIDRLLYERFKNYFWNKDSTLYLLRKQNICMIEILCLIFKYKIFLINNFLLNFTVSFTYYSYISTHEMFNILISNGVNGVLSFQEDWTISKTRKDKSSLEVKLFMINLQNFPSSNCREYNLLEELGVDRSSD